MMAEELIFRKVIDWSCLNWGFTIPLKSHQKFHDYNKKYIPRSKHEEITLIYYNQMFKGILRNVDRKIIESDTLQLLYSADSKFINLLRKEFRSTYKYVISERALAMKKGKKRPQIKIPKEMKEFIEIYGTGVPFKFKINLLPVAKEEIKPKEIADVKKEIKLIESKKISYPCLPDLFSDLIEISYGKVNNKKYKNKVADTLFEDLIFLSFYILGYDEAKQLGYKMSGRKKGYPDGELKSHNTDYLVIYDAKVRGKDYRMNVSDKRAMEDYVRKARVRNFKKIFCVIISSKFADYPRSISGCPLTYLTTKKLIQLISLKIQNPESVNPLSLEDFFSQGILVEDDDLKNWVEEYNLKTLDLMNILANPQLDMFF